MQRLQAETTSLEFNEWLAYLDLDLKVVRREEAYLAQLTLETRRSYLTNPNAAGTVNDFILKFVAPEAPKPATEASIAAAAANSKAFWFAALAKKGKK